MENTNYEKNQGGTPPAQNPTHYPEIEQQPLVDGPAPPMGFAANPTMLHQYQLYYAPDGEAPGQGPITQVLQHTIFVVPAQPTKEPDHLVYSIFTMLCCCLPLGIVALVHSLQTRDANRIGDHVAARQNSRTARIFADVSLGLGLGFCFLCIFSAGLFVFLFLRGVLSLS